MSKYKLNKRCPICGKLLLDSNKTGYCNIHRDRSGENNSFYGKKHSKETIEIIKRKVSKTSKELWQNEEYREKVIRGVSKPRHKGFGEEQSKRVERWYQDNPEQKTIRGQRMKRSWAEGAIVKNGYSCGDSHLEKDLFREVEKLAPNAMEKQTIHVAGGRWVFPDILIEAWGIIVEFYGNFWHANPDIYEEDDVVYNNIIASDIWEKDRKRIKMLENIDGSPYPYGYRVIVVWEKDYKDNKEAILRGLDAEINYEY